MRALVIVCTALGLLATSDLRSDDRIQGGADAVEATLDRLAAMDANAQQAWLLNLEERAIRAARKTLDPAEAAPARGPDPRDAASRVGHLAGARRVAGGHASARGRAGEAAACR